MNDEPAVRIQDLSHAYEENVPAIHHISLEIPDNAFLGIIGHNGAGKTTLVKHFNGLLKPTSGEVSVFGTDTRQTTIASLARHVGYVFQNPDHQVFSPTVREEIAFGLRNLHVAPHDAEARITAVLQDFGLMQFAETPPAILGYGMRRKVSLAAVLAMRPRMIILDEPTVGLDARSTEDIFEHVTRLHHHGHTIVLVTHDMRLAARYCSTCLVMSQGRVLAMGSPRLIFADTALLKRAGAVQPAITRLAARLGDVGMPAGILSVSEFVSTFKTLEAGTQ